MTNPPLLQQGWRCLTHRTVSSGSTISVVRNSSNSRSSGLYAKANADSVQITGVCMLSTLRPDGAVHSAARPLWQKAQAQHELELHTTANPVNEALKHDASQVAAAHSRLLRACTADHGAKDGSSTVAEAAATVLQLRSNSTLPRATAAATRMAGGAAS